MANPDDPNYIKKMEKFEQTLKTFLCSDDFKEMQIWWGCHTSKWHYEYQTLRVQIHPRGKWVFPAPYGWSIRPMRNTCVVVVGHISTHWSCLEKIGVTLENVGIVDRSFDQILDKSPDLAKEIVQKLYDEQVENIREMTRDMFDYLRKNGSVS